MRYRCVAIALAAATSAVSLSAQSPLAGFWELTSKKCTPPNARCSDRIVGTWAADLAIEVRGDVVLITTAPVAPNPFSVGHADTLRIDGKVHVWRAGHRGIARESEAPAPRDSHPIDNRESHPLWPGESWQVSADGRTLVHEYRWKQGDTPYVSAWKYGRKAG